MPTDKELQDLYRRAELAGVLDGDKELRDLTNRASAAGLISGISGEEKDAYRTGKASSQLQGSAINLRRSQNTSQRNPNTNQRTPKLPGVTFRDPQTKKTTGRISPSVSQGDVRQVDRKDEAFIKSLSSMKGQTPEQLRAQDTNAPRFSNKSMGRDFRDMAGAEADTLFMIPEVVRRRMAGDSKGAVKTMQTGLKSAGESVTGRAMGGVLGGSIQQGEGGAASRNFAQGALPGAGSLAGFSAAARVGGSLPIANPLLKGAATLGLGMVGAAGGGTAAAGVQRGLNRFLLGEEGLRELDIQSAIDQRDNPLASSIGQASTALLFGKPTADDMKAIPQIISMVRGGIPLRVALASPAGKMLSETLRERAMEAGVEVLAAAGENLVTGKKMNWQDAGVQALSGALLPGENRIGRVATGAGSNMASTLGGLLSSQRPLNLDLSGMDFPNMQGNGAMQSAGIDFGNSPAAFAPPAAFTPPIPAPRPARVATPPQFPIPQDSPFPMGVQSAPQASTRANTPLMLPEAPPVAPDVLRGRLQEQQRQLAELLRTGTVTPAPAPVAPMVSDAPASTERPQDGLQRERQALLRELVTLTPTYGYEAPNWPIASPENFNYPFKDKASPEKVARLRQIDGEIRRINQDNFSKSLDEREARVKDLEAHLGFSEFQEATVVDYNGERVSGALGQFVFDNEGNLRGVSFTGENKRSIILNPKDFSRLELAPTPQTPQYDSLAAMQSASPDFAMPEYVGPSERASTFKQNNIPENILSGPVFGFYDGKQYENNYIAEKARFMKIAPYIRQFLNANGLDGWVLPMKNYIWVEAGLPGRGIKYYSPDFVLNNIKKVKADVQSIIDDYEKSKPRPRPTPSSNTYDSLASQPAPSLPEPSAMAPRYQEAGTGRQGTYVNINGVPTFMKDARTVEQQRQERATERESEYRSAIKKIPIGAKRHAIDRLYWENEKLTNPLAGATYDEKLKLDSDTYKAFLSKATLAQKKALAWYAKVGEQAERNLIQGKPVPPQVLADYPHLVLKYNNQSSFVLTLLRLKGIDSLTPEQKRTYEDLLAEKTKASRKAQAPTRPSAPAPSGQSYAITEHFHSKRGANVYIAAPAGRAEFKSELARAKALGGYYSRAWQGSPGGFAFKTNAEATAFVEGSPIAPKTNEASTEEDATSKNPISERMRATAERMEEAATESLNRDRKANTAKRASQAASAEADANRSLRIAKTMRAIADAIESGTAKYLDGVKSRTVIEDLDSLLKAAKWAAVRANGERTDTFDERPVTIEDIDKAEYPYPELRRSDLKQALSDLSKKRIGKARLASLEANALGGEPVHPKKIGNLPVDSVDTYSFTYEDREKIGYGKKIPESVYVYAIKAGGNVKGAEPGQIIYTTQKEPFMGQMRMFTTPKDAAVSSVSSATVGVAADTSSRFYTPYDPSRWVTIKSTTDIELLQSVGQLPDWQVDRFKRLQTADIKTPAELKAALREYLGLVAPAPASDPIKKAERELIGRKIPGYFPTPPALVEKMLGYADVQPGMSVLEPSAGKGNIADAIKEAHPDAQISAIEPVETLRTILEAKGYELVGRDFLQHEGEYDRIVMNPPFEDGQDMAHVRHAYDLLKPGGTLVAITSEGPFFRSDKKAQEFRQWLEETGATDEKNPDKSFMDSERSTGVATRMVTIEKPANAPRNVRTADTLKEEASAPNSLSTSERDAASNPNSKYGVFYHGSPTLKRHEDIKPGKSWTRSPLGIFFTTRKSQAETYARGGKVLDFELSPNARIADMDDPATRLEIAEWMEQYGDTAAEDPQAWADMWDSTDPLDNDPGVVESEDSKFHEALGELGYDGAYHTSNIGERGTIFIFDKSSVVPAATKKGAGITEQPSTPATPVNKTPGTFTRPEEPVKKTAESLPIHELTLKEYAEQERRKGAEENGVTLKEMREFFPDSHYASDYDRAIIAAYKESKPISKRVLDSLDEGFVTRRLMHDWPDSKSLPDGYLVPSVRKQNEEQEALNRGIRSGRLDAQGNVKPEWEAKKTAESMHSTLTPQGKAATVYTPDNETIPVRWHIMEASDLIPSHDGDFKPRADYEQSLQPRDRSRAATQEQVAEMAARLNPERLADSASTAEGAPIIGKDRMVESGNGRTMSILSAYDKGGKQAQAYREFVAKNADEYGIDTAQVRAMKKPVLVRVREGEITPKERASLASRMGASPVATMSPTEKAQQDAQRLISSGALQAYVPNEQGSLNTAPNNDFRSRFLSSLPVSERAEFYKPNGALSPDGEIRLQRGLMAAAYGDGGLLTRLLETGAEENANLARALQAGAGKIATLRQAVDRGEVGPVDISEDVAQAANDFITVSRQKGIQTQEAVKAHLAQQGLFGDDLSPVAQEVLAFFGENNRSGKRMGDLLTTYADLAMATKGAAGSLTGERSSTAQEILDAAIRRVSGEAKSEQPGLFDEGPAATGGRNEGSSRQAQPQGTPRPSAQAPSPVVANERAGQANAYREAPTPGVSEEVVAPVSANADAIADKNLSTQLQGAAPTLERAIGIASQFWMGSTITAEEVAPGIYELSNKKGIITGARIIKKGARFRFETFDKDIVERRATLKAAQAQEAENLKSAVDKAASRLYSNPLPDPAIISAAGKWLAYEVAIRGIDTADAFRNQAEAIRTMAEEFGDWVTIHQEKVLESAREFWKSDVVRTLQESKASIPTWIEGEEALGASEESEPEVHHSQAQERDESGRFVAQEVAESDNETQETISETPAPQSEEQKASPKPASPPVNPDARKLLTIAVQQEIAEELGEDITSRDNLKRTWADTFVAAAEDFDALRESATAKALSENPGTLSDEERVVAAQLQKTAREKLRELLDKGNLTQEEEASLAVAIADAALYGRAVVQTGSEIGRMHNFSKALMDDTPGGFMRDVERASTLAEGKLSQAQQRALLEVARQGERIQTAVSLRLEERAQASIVEAQEQAREAASKPARYRRTSANPKSATYGQTNEKYTRERYEEAKKKAQAILTGRDSRPGQRGATLIDDAPIELMRALVDIGGFHFEAGLKRYADWATQVREDIGQSVSDKALGKVWNKVVTESRRFMTADEYKAAIDSRLETMAQTGKAPATRPRTTNPLLDQGVAEYAKGARSLEAFARGLEKRLGESLPEPMLRDLFKEAARKYSVEKIPIKKVRQDLSRKIEAEVLKTKPLFTRKLKALEAYRSAMRSIVTSVDFSGLGNQGGILAVSRPALAVGGGGRAGAIRHMIESARSEENLAMLTADIESNQATKYGDKDFYKKAGLELSETGAGAELTSKEENFLSNMASKIPLVAGSERAYSAVLNSLRSATFDALYQTGMSMAEAKDLARYINVASGRGDLSHSLKMATPMLANIFFSPRYGISRVQYLVAQPLVAASTSRTRAIIAKEYARYLSKIALAISLGIAGGLVKSNLPEKDKDGNKIPPLQRAMLALTNSETGVFKIPVPGTAGGEIYFDFYSSNKQWLTFAATLLSGQKVNQEGELQDSGLLDTAGRMFRSKLAPDLGMAVNWGKDRYGDRTDFIGNPTTVEGTLRGQLPMSLTEVIKGFAEIGTQPAEANKIMVGLGLVTASVLSAAGFKANYRNKTQEQTERETAKAAKKTDPLYHVLDQSSPLRSLIKLPPLPVKEKAKGAPVQPERPIVRNPITGAFEFQK